MIPLLKLPTSVARLCVIIINNIYCLPTYVIWMGLLIPLKKIQPNIYYKIEGIFFHWLLAVVSMWSYSAGYDIVEVGDNIEECLNKRTLVIANHQSTADVPLLMANFNAKEHVLPNIMWIMDHLFKYTNFGIVSLIHGDFFITSGRSNREKSIIELKTHLKSTFLKNGRKWIVLFPEGGFLRKRRPISQKFAEKNGLPSLEHVTIPRVGAMKAIFEVMTKLNTEENENNILKVDQRKSHILNGEAKKKKNFDSPTPLSIETNKWFQKETLLEYVLDITIAYPNGKPVDLPNILHGWRNPCKTHMLYRLYKVSEIPKEYDQLTNWIYDRFIEKNSLLKNFYESGQFYNDRILNSYVIQQDTIRFLLINLFFITSTYFHYQVISSMYHYCTHLLYSNAL